MKLFYTSSWHPGFKHSPAIVHNIFACFAFSLSATKINMVKEWCWFFQINVFHKYFPHLVKILFLSRHFDFVHVHRQEQSFLSVNEQTFSIWNFFPTVFQKNFLELPFPQQSWERMTVQIPLKKNDWTFQTGPWFRPFVFWQTYQNIWTFWFWIFEQFVSILPFWPGFQRIPRLRPVQDNLVALM